MSRSRIPVCMLLACFAAAMMVQALSAQDLNLQYITDTDVVAPGGRISYTLAVSNTGSADLNDVQVQIQKPEPLGNFQILGDGFSCYFDVCTWTVGSLSPGDGRQVVVFTNVGGSAEPGTMVSEATASATGASDVSTSVEVTIDETPLMQLSVAPAPGPAAPGQDFTYTLTYGNIGSTSPEEVVLRFLIPDGTTFASASHGGFESGGVVTWNLGTVGVGAGGQVQAVVVSEASLDDGHILVANGEIDPGIATENVVSSSAATLVQDDTPLHVIYAVSQTALAPRDRLTYTVVASNTGATELNDVEVAIKKPAPLGNFQVLGDGFSCYFDVCTFAVGTLAPGEAKEVAMFTDIDASAPQGEVLRSEALATSASSGQVTASQDVQVDPTPLLRLSTAADAGPIHPGVPFTYTLSVSNVGATSPSDVVLRARIPDGAGFDSATHGGVLTGDMMTWNLGVLGVGASKQVRLTILPSGDLSDGSTLLLYAELDPAIETEYLVRSTAVTRVRSNNPLHVEYGVSQTALGAGDRLTYALAASNTGAVELTDVTVQIQKPEPLGNFQVVGDGFGCYFDVCTWTIAALPAGEARQIVLFTHTNAGAAAGAVMRSRMVAESAGSEQVTSALDVHIDPTPLLRLSLASSAAPAVEGEPLTYALTFSNIGSSSPSDVLLSAAIPEGTSFESATCGASLVDGVATWNLGTLPAGSGGSVWLKVMPNTGIEPGRLIATEAELDPQRSSELTTRSIAVVPVGEPSDLRFEANVVPRTLEPGSSIEYSLTATNTGVSDLNDIEITIQKPEPLGNFQVVGEGFSCYFDVCTWAIETLGPDQTRTLTLTTDVSSNAARGEVMRGVLMATATGARLSTLRMDLVSGALKNLAPMSTTITSPSGTEPILIGGTGLDDAVRPDSMFAVEWTPTCDPEGDVLAYTWQLADDAGFDTIIEEGASEDGGAATRFEIGFGTLAARLSDYGAQPGGELMLYHRILASDGVNVVPGEPAAITFTRGTIVGTEKAPGLPEVFALHGNYPNPFNPTTTFAFDLPEPASVRLSVFDAIGRLVATVVSERLPAGTYEYDWKAEHLPSGMYVYRLEAGPYTSTGKLILLK